MSNAYLALGANLGDRLESIRAAARMLADDGSTAVVAASSVYETAPVGPQDQPSFFNAVVRIETHLEPRELLVRCLEVENRLGRTRTIRWGPRVIDIDILLYDGLTVSEHDLQIPHPRMAERSFVLAPLAEIAPEAQLGDGTTAADALGRVGRAGIVRIAVDPSWLEQ